MAKYLNDQRTLFLERYLRNHKRELTNIEVCTCENSNFEIKDLDFDLQKKDNLFLYPLLPFIVLSFLAGYKFHKLTNP